MRFLEKDMRRMLDVQAEKDRTRTEVRQLIGMLSSAVERTIKPTLSILEDIRPIFQVEVCTKNDCFGKPAPIWFVLRGNGKWSFIFSTGHSNPYPLDYQQIPTNAIRRLRETMPEIISDLTDRYPRLGAEMQTFFA